MKSFSVTTRSRGGVCIVCYILDLPALTNIIQVVLCQKTGSLAGRALEMIETKRFANVMQQQKKNQPRLAEKAAEAIRDMVIGNVFEPGEPLSEVRIGEMLGISRTPVREAISQLDQEGLLRIIPGRGAIVAKMTVEDIKEINDLRMVLEPLAVETALNDISDEDVKRCRYIWEQFLDRFEKGENLSSEELSEADTALHGLILDRCKNNRLRNFLNVLHFQIMRYVFASWKTQEYVADTIRQHLDIVHFLQAKDVEGLKNALRAHIEFNNRYQLERML